MPKSFTSSSELLLIFKQVRDLLKRYESKFQVRMDFEGRYELWTDKEVEIEGKKRDALFFAGLIIQSTYVGFYFMPLYEKTHIKDIFSPDLLKLLKGKSCFHITKMDGTLANHIQKALEIGFDFYKDQKWI